MGLDSFFIIAFTRPFAWSQPLPNAPPSLRWGRVESILRCVATLTVGAGEPAALAGGISKRVLRLVKAQVEDWHDVCGACRIGRTIFCSTAGRWLSQTT